jgi:hypothetical protein
VTLKSHQSLGDASGALLLLVNEDHKIMAIKKWGVAKVKGAEPEQFFIFLAVHRSSVRASDFLSEQELRSDLKNRGIRETEIRLLINRARANPQ